MASVYLHSLILLSFLLFSHSYSHSSPLFLPLTKHPHTKHHLTLIFNTTLVLDLNSPFLWTTHLSSSSSSSSIEVIPIPRRSIQCSAAGFHQSRSSDQRCTISIQNPITGQTGVGELLALDHFLHVSAPRPLLTGLPNSSKGVLGLGRNPLGVVQQLSHTFGLPNKFSLCFSSSSSSSHNGLLLFGETQQTPLYQSMIFTPILLMSHKYHIKLKSIKLQNKKLPLDLEIEQLSTIQITTLSPYTLMESRIYKAIINAYAIEAEIMKMSRVNPVGEFELCYSIKETRKVPVIDLVLQSQMLKWRIDAPNSMVKVNQQVMCLGILDGGDELKAAIVLGTYQLEDHLIHFDLSTLMIGLTSSLLNNQSTCSQFASSMRKHVQYL